MSSKALAELAAATKSAVVVLPAPETLATTVIASKPLTDDEKWKALKGVEAQLNKQFNTTTSLVRLGKRVGVPVPSIETGMPTFDYGALQCGGIPRGRIIEIYGPESSGKTTLALHIVACDQKQGNLCAYVDAEHALDPTYAKKLGVDVDNLMVAQPDSGEQALETAEALIESRAVSVVVIDSVAALVPQAELDGEMGDSHMGLQARLMSQAMRKLRGKAAINGVTVIFINQIREKIGVMFGSPETTTGGRALKFYASVRLDVRKIGGDDGKIKNGDVQVGHKVRIKAVKNRFGAPFGQSEVDLIYGVGFDTGADLVQYAVDLGVIERSGAWFKFDGENIGQGIDKTKANITEDPKLLAAVKSEVVKARKAQLEAELEK